MKKDFTGVDTSPLSYEGANKLYTFLVEHAGAVEDERDMFVHEMCRPFPVFPAWRFRGSLGQSGSFQRREDRWIVLASPDDIEMYGTAKLIEGLNVQLQDLRASLLANA